MNTNFLVYGSYGFVGQVIAELAIQMGLNPILAGRDANKVRTQATQLGREYCVFDLDDLSALDHALSGVNVVLHCAGPYIYTSKLMVDGCLRTNTHYLDLTGEIPVYESLATRDSEAKVKGVMILPGVGFDVVPTDCLALHLKQRLPSATHLTLAFCTEGPAGLPPGTAKTTIEMIPYGNKIRKDSQLIKTKSGLKSRLVDFGQGEKLVTQLPWGDTFMAYYSTKIPNIEDYALISKSMRQNLLVSQYFRPFFKFKAVRDLFKRSLKSGSTKEERAISKTHVWGEVKDEHGHLAVSRLHGPEAGVDWTAITALAAVQKVLEDHVKPGFQTPASVFGADFVLESDQVTREDLN
ncbi:MAG: saccharopine dehydrogenase family protein [Anaerolineaceae bacterium]